MHTWRQRAPAKTWGIFAGEKNLKMVLACVQHLLYVLRVVTHRSGRLMARLDLRIPPAQREWLRDRADLLGIGISDVVRMLILTAMGRQETLEPPEKLNGEEK